MPEATATHKHGAIGGSLPLRDMTKLTTGGQFLASAAGHLADGSIYTVHGVDYRVRVS